MKHELFYDETIPVMMTFLGNLQTILKKAEKSLLENKQEESTLLLGRLAPDMYTLTQQVGYAYFMALETATALSGKTAPSFTYDEKTIQELVVSLDRAIAFLATVKPKDMEAYTGKRVTTFLLPSKKLSQKVYVREFALPNFFFHVTTAYDILRHLGIPLKKEDYLGSGRYL